MQKIAIVTGSRADWGLLEPLVKQLEEEFDIGLIVTGSHLSNQFGYTGDEIVSHEPYKVNILMDSDTFDGVCDAMGMGLIKFPLAFNTIRPDYVIVLGDRFEIFCGAGVACVSRIPIAHIHGGETTQGAVDEAFRPGLHRYRFH